MATDNPPRARGTVNSAPGGTANGTPGDAAAESDGPDGREPPAPTIWRGRRAAWIGGTVGVALVAWFFVAWRVLHRELPDAAGESIGSAFALLLVVSLVGAFRAGR
ncbi:MAG TPA: hypothetical protein VF054_03415 [Micromonosporaceae bacterium]